MKKVIISLVLFFSVMFIVPVNAANYELRELIPLNTKTTIKTKVFLYKQFYYNYSESDTSRNHFIYFEKVKNLTNESRPFSVSIGVFDSDKKNMGIMNYCASSDNTYVTELILKGKEEKKYVIEVDDVYLPEGKTLNDIKYFAILGDNKNCRTEGSQEFIGREVDEIGKFEDSEIDDDSMMLIKMLIVIGVLLFILFLYKVLFTTAYDNMDGEDVRRVFVYKNRKLKEKREREEREHPTPPPVKKQIKTNEVLEQEEKEKNKEEDSTDLHNMYK